ncbi:MAG: dihydroorotate dehydrogenase electron transfer subunit [Lachnospiraceae bacterium]|nr:dihydroorotate dehydrogenase electron transfer subunit [Lachnospiraceae bacterium]
MTQTILTITDNCLLAPGVFRMRLAGLRPEEVKPGQFVEVRVPGTFLRRPISVCDAEDGVLTLIYKAVGDGTRILAGMRPGETLDVLAGLGNGYDLTRAGTAPVLVGGGVGIPPLYYLAKELLRAEVTPRVLLGFNRSDEIFYEDEFAALGAAVTVVTLDGSAGEKGFVTEHLPADLTCFYACGPLPMLKALCRATDRPGQLSLEERMGCGFGACMGCSIQTAEGPKRVCKEGPVFEREVLGW